MIIRGIFPWCFTPELYAARPDYIESLTAFVRPKCLTSPSTLRIGSFLSAVAVMLVAPEPAPLLDAALELMEAAVGEGEQFPAVHAGAAHGQALRRWGDYYGGPVNLAARLTERARPSSLITDGVMRERAGDDGFAWTEAGFKRLKGMSEPTPVWRCRRAA